jgi:hypothetical protein
MSKVERKAAASEDDGFVTAMTLFAFFAICISGSAYLYWHGTGKLPWQ